MIYFLILASIVILILNLNILLKVYRLKESNNINITHITNIVKSLFPIKVLNAIIVFLFFSFMVYSLYVCTSSILVFLGWLFISAVLKPYITMILIAIFYTQVGGLQLLILFALIRFINWFIAAFCEHNIEKLTSELNPSNEESDMDNIQEEYIDTDFIDINSDIKPYD